MQQRYHSVYLDKDRCKGCTNCLKRCPTEAIRVRQGRARIIAERCIDCGECIRVCAYHAKIARTDPLSSISAFPYKIALPAPSLFGQYKGIQSISQVIYGLKQMGFDEVFEVARGADIASMAIRERLKDKSLPRPLISSACPAVVRLIQVRFPDLISHLVDVRQPIEIAASLAKKEFCEKHSGVKPEEVGCFFITPCAAKMTAIRTPIGHTKSAVDGAISMLEIYGLLSSQAKKAPIDESLVESSAYGLGWGRSGGESKSIFSDNALAVDGIENVIHVLEDVENNKLRSLEFVEGNACTGGCVGGPLCFENPYIARNAIRKLVESRMEQGEVKPPDEEILDEVPVYMDAPILPNSVMQLDEDMLEAMRKMEEMEHIAKELPGYDCGSCGSPTCRTFAEDIVRGFAREMDCIHKMKKQLSVMAQQMVELAQSERE